MKIFLSAGEPSGDLHAANLIRAIRRQQPNAEFVGFGGPNMAQVGCQLLHDMTSLAVMWFLHALLNLHKFWRLAGQAERYFRSHRPDAVVLIDFPGFNWWIARRAKAHNIPVFYYTPPQLWAWASWRVKKMRRLVDHVLCTLPFEQTWFEQRGCRALFVGHPFFDEVRRHQPDLDFMREQAARSGRLVALLPGSRNQEVERNLPTLLGAAAEILRQVPNVRFALACFKPAHFEFAKAAVESRSLPIDVYCQRTPELMRLAECCIAVSGSVSLELLYHQKPTAIVYRAGRVGYFLQDRFRRARYITLVNLLACANIDRDRQRGDGSAPVFPEFLTYDNPAVQVAAVVSAWLSDEGQMQAVRDKLRDLRDRYAQSGACAAGAGYILETLEKRPRNISRPHFDPATAIGLSHTLAPLDAVKKV